VADVVSILAAIDEKDRKKVAARLRSLLSDRDNEVVMAARALNNELKRIGADIHDLAQWVEDPLSEVGMKAILDRGVAIGIEQERARSASNGHGTPHGTPSSAPMPSVLDMMQWCFDRVDQLSKDKDREFIRSAYRRVVILRRSVTPKMQPWLEDCYFKLGGPI
jgi:hypothetical protein